MVRSGLLCLYKPRNWSSSDCVVKIRNILQAHMRKQTGSKQRLKVGHGGTLDPMAEGVLVLGVGRGTKLMGEYLKGYKRYRVEAVLGVETDSLDSTGHTTHTSDCSHVTLDRLERELCAFRGHILQRPPMFSALNHNGQRLYKLARQGKEVDRAPRAVEVRQLDLVRTVADSVLQLPAFQLEMETSGGFYVRSLISDLGRACDTHAHMTALVRLQQGPFCLADCLHQKDWSADRILDKIVSIDDLPVSADS
mmetsp:Transcript_12227/g.19915  ORF Transcript_12227/g.19915 Transcript_12227/m.19915 type:complete len:251 (-) Transcript_12227:2274-3026(-)